MELKRIWIAVAGVCLGVSIGTPPIGARAAIATAVIPVLLLAARRPRSLGTAGLLLLSVAAGAVDAAARSRATLVEELARKVPMCEVAGRVIEHQGGLGTYLGVEDVRCNGLRHRGRLGTVAVNGVVGEAGGRFRGSARLVPLTRSGYDAARRRQGASASISGAELTYSSPEVPARRVAARIRRGLIDGTAELDPRRAALLRGLTIGDTEDMDRDTTNRLRRSGLTHLVAVSGSNVAIVVGAVAWLLAPTGIRIRTLGAAGALALFVLVVGPEPSVLRAAAMGSIAIVALASGRRAEPLNTLGLALLAVVLWRPGLLSSAGLQLSAGATAGLVLWSAPIAARLRLPRPLALVAAATLAAQVAVAPLLIVLFGQLSVVAPVANLLAVPAVPAATILGLASGVVAPFSLSGARLLARAAEPFASWILLVGDVAGGASWAAVDLPRTAGWILAAPVIACAWSTLRSDAGSMRTHSSEGSTIEVSPRNLPSRSASASRAAVCASSKGA